ncbi:MAG: hypothetical protein ACFFAN_08455 [Promethearchaeota archaeon]
MSQEIDDLFKKFNDVFLGRKEELREYLIRNFKKVFKDQIAENVERIDSTKRIKTAGFHPELSSWRNSYRNIIVSSCEVIKGKKKRYDYKFYFVEEKLDEKTIETIENAIAEASRLKLRFKFDDAVAKIDEMVELIRLEDDKVFNKRLYDFRRDVISTKEKYEKGLEKISQLEEELEINQENDNLEGFVSNCEKIIEISESIRKKDLVKKYSDILEQTKKEIEKLKEIANIEKKLQLNRTNGKLEVALSNCEKIIEISESINRNSLVEKYSQIKDDLKKEIQAIKEKYEKALEEIEELEEKIKYNREKGNLGVVVSDYQEIIAISKSIKKLDLVKKYSQILEQTKKEIKAQKELTELEKQFKQNRENSDFEAAISNSIKIIRISKSINRDDLVEKYSKFKEELKKELLSAKEKYEKLLRELEDLEKEFKDNRQSGNNKAALKNCERIMEIADSVGKNDLIVKYSKIYEQVNKEIEEKESAKLANLKAREELVQKAKEIEEVIEFEQNVLPLVEEFSVDDILGDLSDDINESLEQIDSILNEHRVDVKKEITNKAILTSASGEVIELEKTIGVIEPEKIESPNINIQSELINPFDDIIEEAIITDLIPYNYEIVNVELNGKVVEELPDHSLTEEGLELKWKLQNIQPKEKVEINYDLRRRISRTIIFILKGSLKIVKTHSNLKELELEGTYEAILPFTNSYGSILDGVIVEDIIPLYYLHSIKEPTNLSPTKILNSKQGDLVKWNVGAMEQKTLNYHYKLLELYKFEELKILINTLDKEGLTALNNHKLGEALGKFTEIRNHLENYIG